MKLWTWCWLYCVQCTVVYSALYIKHCATDSALLRLKLWGRQAGGPRPNWSHHTNQSITCNSSSPQSTIGQSYLGGVEISLFVCQLPRNMKSINMLFPSGAGTASPTAGSAFNFPTVSQWDSVLRGTSRGQEGGDWGLSSWTTKLTWNTSFAWLRNSKLVISFSIVSQVWSYCHWPREEERSRSNCVSRELGCDIILLNISKTPLNWKCSMIFISWKLSQVGLRLKPEMRSASWEVGQVSNLWEAQ